MGSRSESLSNCSIGKKRLEKSPSFASEWDEVRLRVVSRKRARLAEPPALTRVPMPRTSIGASAAGFLHTSTRVFPTAGRGQVPWSQDRGLRACVAEDRSTYG